MAAYAGHASDSPGSLYLVALYWACMTITTVGYGDVVRGGMHPRTPHSDHGVMGLPSCNDGAVVVPWCCGGGVVQPAQTDLERLVASLAMITGAFIFAYIVGSVCNIATSLASEANACVGFA
jgi:hypothetical protein